MRKVTSNFLHWIRLPGLSLKSLASWCLLIASALLSQHTQDTSLFSTALPSMDNAITAVLRDYHVSLVLFIIPVLIALASRLLLPQQPERIAIPPLPPLFTRNIGSIPHVALLIVVTAICYLLTQWIPATPLERLFGSLVISLATTLLTLERSALTFYIKSLLKDKIFWIVILLYVCICKYSISIIKSPEYALRGIESGFFDFTLTLSSSLSNISVSNIPSPWDVGAYGDHPAGISYIQLIFYRLLGESFAAWRSSTTWIFYFSLLPLYLWLKELLGRPLALTGSIIFASTFYGFQFSKMGYNNIHYITFWVTALWLLTLAIRYQSQAAIFIAGAVSGLAAYINYMGLILPCFCLHSFIVTAKQSDWPKHQRTEFLYILLTGIAISLTPFIYHLDHHIQLFVHFTDPSARSFTALSLSQFLPSTSRVANFIFTGLHPLLYAECPLYYLDAKLFDAVSAVLFYFGIFHYKKFLPSCLARTSCSIMSTHLLILVIIMGYFNRYDHPAFTRMFFFIPTISLFATVAIAALLTHLPPLCKSVLWGIILVGISFLNVLSIDGYKTKWGRFGYCYDITSYLTTFNSPQSSSLTYIDEASSEDYRNVTRQKEWLPFQREITLIESSSLSGVNPSTLHREVIIGYTVKNDLEIAQLLTNRGYTQAPPIYCAYNRIYNRFLKGS